MRILFLSAYYAPEIGSGPKYAAEWAETMASYGHHVTVVTGFPHHNLPATPSAYKNKLWQREMMNGVHIFHQNTMDPNTQLRNSTTTGY